MWHCRRPPPLPFPGRRRKERNRHCGYESPIPSMYKGSGLRRVASVMWGQRAKEHPEQKARKHSASWLVPGSNTIIVALLAIAVGSLSSCTQFVPLSWFPSVLLGSQGSSDTSEMLPKPFFFLSFTPAMENPQMDKPPRIRKHLILRTFRVNLTFTTRGAS